MRTTISAAALVLLAACNKTEKTGTTETRPMPDLPPSAATGTAPVTAIGIQQPGKTHILGKNFSIDAASDACRAGSECAMTITLSAAPSYHINKEYPYKFVASAAPGVAFLGKEAPGTFSRASGDFKEQNETSATMTVRFKPAAAGETKISGTYRMSVCNEEHCQIEQQPVTVQVPVS